MRGTVRKWFPKRGYGFIKGEDRKDYFVHWKSVQTKGKWKYLTEGESVTFTLEEGEKNKVTNVKPDRSGYEQAG